MSLTLKCVATNFNETLVVHAQSEQQSDETTAGTAPPFLEAGARGGKTVEDINGPLKPRSFHLRRCALGHAAPD